MLRPCSCPTCTAAPARVSLDRCVTLLDGSAGLSTVAPFVSLHRGGRAVTLPGPAWAAVLAHAIGRGYRPTATRRLAPHALDGGLFDSVRLSDGPYGVADDPWPGGYAGGPHTLSPLDAAALARALSGGARTVAVQRVRDLLARGQPWEPLRIG